MTFSSVEIPTAAGRCDCHFFSPPQGGAHPAVILYMDAFGIRPALDEMAQRMASAGYDVLLPNLYYRSGPPLPFDPATAFTDGPERARLMAGRQLISNAAIMEDTGHFLEFFEQQPGTRGQKVGCVGYCMGGAFALSAAGTFPEKVAAAASFHGARLASDQPDSPRLLAPKMKAGVYVGIAGIDPHFTTEEKNRLEAALASAHVAHTVEVYEGAKHGFAVNDHPVYDAAAAERHWRAIFKLFAENLGT